MTRKYLKIVTDKETIDIEEIENTEIRNDILSILLKEKRTVEVLGLERKDLQEIQEIVKSKRMISKEEIAEAIKKNIDIQNIFKNLNTEEHSLLYKTFGELLLKTAKKKVNVKIEQKTPSGRARFILSNKLAMQAYFNLKSTINIAFSSFVALFYSGYLMVGTAENEVDTEIFKILNRTICTTERVNALSMLLQDEIEEKEELKPKQNKIQKTHLINPGLIKLLSENLLNIKEKDKKDNFKKNQKKLTKPVLSVPEIVIHRINRVRKVELPGNILKRMKEISKLICKSKTPTEEIKTISKNLHQSIKEEIRRTLPIEEGDAVMIAIDRIVPTRFINEPEEKISNK